MKTENEKNRLINSLVCCGAFAFCLGTIAQAQWSSNPSVNTQITLTAGSDNPSVASDGSGGILVAWIDATTSRVFAQKVDASGIRKWGSTGVQVSSLTPVFSPVIVSDDSGGAMVLWRKDATIYAQRISFAGAPLLVNDLRIGGGSVGVSQPSAITDGSGGVLAIFTSYSSAGYLALNVTRASRGGQVLWAVSPYANSAPNFAQIGSGPMLALGTNDDVAAVWTDGRNGNSNFDVFAQRLRLSTGQATWVTGGVRVCGANSNPSQTQVVASFPDRFIVAWSEQRTNDYRVYAERLNYFSGAREWGDTNGVKLNDTGPYQINTLQLVPSAQSGAICVFNSFSEIVASAVNSSGVPLWIGNITSVTGNQERPSIVPDGLGGAVIAWQDFRNGSNSEIYAQRISSSGSFLWAPNGRSISVGSANRLLPSITKATTGNSIISWTDYRSGVANIFAQRVDSSGNLGIGIFQSSNQFSFQNTRTNLVRDSTISVTNSGSSLLRVSSVTSSNPSLFIPLTTSGTIQPSQTVQFSVRFAPTTPGLQQAQLIFTHDGDRAIDTVRLSGLGIGSPARLLVSVQPPLTTTAGGVFGASVRLEDINGNLVYNDNTTIVNVARNAGNGSLQGTLTAQASGGIATFTNLYHTVAGTVDIRFSSGSLTPATSNSILVNPGPATKVAFAQQPTNTTAGATITPSITVRLRDTYDNDVQTQGVSVGMALNSGSGTLSGTTTKQTNVGVATFDNLSINLSGAKVLTASSSGLTSAVSNTFTITPGFAAQLTISTQPSATATAGTVFSQQPVVRIEDAIGNLIITDSSSVVTATRNAGSGTLQGTLTATARGGIATFTGLYHTFAGTMNIRFTSLPALNSTTSSDIVVNPSVASKVVFGQHPSNAGAGATITPPVTVQLQDAFNNNVVTNGVSIGIALTAGTGALSGTTPRTTTAGLATFNDLSINLVGPKNLTASSAGLTSAVSNSFTIGASPAVRLNISVQPSDTATAGVVFARQPAVRIEDANGNLVTTDNSTIVTAARLAGNGTLQGTLTATASGGLATFTNLSHTVANTITVRFIAGTLVSDTSNNIVINSAAARNVTAVQGTPQSTQVNTPFAVLLKVRVTDDWGNVVSDSNVTFTAPTFGATGTFTGGSATAIVSTGSDGSATAPVLTANGTVGGPYSVTARVQGAGTTATFSLTNTTAALGNIIVQSGSGQQTPINTQFPTPLQAKVRDASNNPRQGVTVTFTVVPSSGASATFFNGVNTATTQADGIATAQPLTANGIAGSYTVTATAPEVSGPTTFTLTNEPAGGSATLTTQAADAITFTGATLHGQVVASGVTGTAYFEYGQDTSLAGATSTPAQSVGSGAAALQAAVAGLQPHTVYYFRLNSSLTTTPGTTLNFRTLNNVVPVSGTVPFSATVSQSTDYRLVSMPGSSPTPVSTFIAGAGNQTYDWRAYTDDGYNFIELSAVSQVSPGEGIWLIRKNAFSFSSNGVTLPNLPANNAYPIRLKNTTWNIVANPFDKSVSWDSVRAKNNNLGRTLWSYGGSFEVAAQMEPLRAYYVTRSGAPETLWIPYPVGSQGTALAPRAPITWQIQLTVSSDINTDQYNFIGVAPSANEELDALDEYKPPLVFDQTFLYFSRPQWDTRYAKFGSDFRPAVGEGQVWDFVVRNPRLSRTTISWEDVERIPSEHKVVLLRIDNARPVDMRGTHQWQFQPREELTTFRVVVGRSEFIDQKISENKPVTYRLEQNYPNPFNPTTTIMYQLPQATHVTLTVYNTLGQEVATLANGFEDGGYKSVEFKTSGMASGVYLYRLIAGQYVATKKLMVVR